MHGGRGSVQEKKSRLSGRARANARAACVRTRVFFSRDLVATMYTIVLEIIVMVCDSMRGTNSF